jgi:hypothetical protein
MGPIGNIQILNQLNFSKTFSNTKKITVSFYILRIFPNRSLKCFITNRRKTSMLTMSLSDISQSNTRAGGSLIMDKQWTKLSRSIESHFSNYIKLGVPSSEKAYQLAKLVQFENGVAISKAVKLVAGYYQIPYRDRADSRFQAHFGISPYPWLIDQFVLNLKNIQTNETLIRKAATDTLFFLRGLESNPPEEINTEAVILHSFFHALKKCWSSNSSLGLSDFLSSWQWHVFRKYGEKYEWYFTKIFEDLKAIELDKEIPPTEPRNQYLLTQTEIDWLQTLQFELEINLPFSRFPLSTGPKKPALIELERITRTLARSNSIDEDIKIKLTNHVRLKIQEILMVNVAS